MNPPVLPSQQSYLLPEGLGFRRKAQLPKTIAFVIHAAQHAPGVAAQFEESEFREVDTANRPRITLLSCREKTCFTTLLGYQITRRGHCLLQLEVF
jgi:hypothetical protein